MAQRVQGSASRGSPLFFILKVILATKSLVFTFLPLFCPKTR